MPHGQQLVVVLQHLIGNLSEKGMHLLLPVVSVTMQIIPDEGPQLLEPALKALLGDILGGTEPSTVVAGESDFTILRQEPAIFAARLRSNSFVPLNPARVSGPCCCGVGESQRRLYQIPICTAVMVSEPVG